MRGPARRQSSPSGFARAIGALVTALTIAGAPLHAEADPKPKPSKGAKAEPKPKKRAGAAAKAPLNGATHDYTYDGRDIGHPERAWHGRAFVHSRAAASSDKPLPLLVFIHGLNGEGIKFRWMGGGNEGDVRRIVSELIEGDQVPPMLVAAPSSVVPSAVTNAVTSWPAFDLDRFIEKTEEQLRGVATIDRSRILVAGHSGGGCNSKGGLATALKGKTRALAALAIDTCMGPDVATELARADPATHVVVSWQTMTWAKRPIDDFRRTFLREVSKAPAQPGVFRELEHVKPTEPMPHDAMVGATLRTWLPKLLAGTSAADADGSKVDAPCHGG